MTCVLVISAHPDDMEIGMGGTVAKFSAAGKKIQSLILTDGRRSADPFGVGAEGLAEIRRSEALIAAASLGIETPVSVGLPNLDEEELRASAVTQLHRIISSHPGCEIYTLHPELDRHPTHRLAGKLTIEAAKGTSVSAIWAYEAWGLFAHWDRLEDISNQMGSKLKAIAAHRSQVASTPYAEGVCGLNRWRAVFAEPHQTAPGASYVEAFIRLR